MPRPEAMSEPELPKRYDPKDFETRLYASWESHGYFTPPADEDRPRFSIMIPPPNVTGRLHIGHALVNTLQDIVVRWKRMSGFNTLWLPGSDHAGIATQMVVERELAREGISRIELGREAFEQRVWEWKESYGNQIFEQLKRLGASCDWSRARFTLDEGLSQAVRHVFVRLYEDGLIYRDLAMVNWCPRCQTAISDIEVEYEDREGSLWEIRYPLADGDGALTVATTRPETMLGDTGVAVHPDDERYRHLIGREVVLPIVGRRIPIVADAILVDPAFGTGVVKITPSHDRNDYETGIRHALPRVQVIDEKGRMSDTAGELRGLDRFEARERIVDTLREQGFLASVKPHAHAVGTCGKCETVVEPMISQQWFVKIAPLAGPALDAVRNGDVRITPQQWEATYYNWMENIHDWCISRQLWWGHRIPAWNCAECGELIVAEEPPQRCTQCESGSLRQETDVLDTWFSSALWPFSTLGWPKETADYRAFYPTDTLITGFDILFFWVARMIMMGLRFTGTVPFSNVFLNGLVRDEHGQKMSKSKGNVIDPLEVIDEFGADPVRFTLAILSSGRDIPLARNRMEGYRAFATKIWNAARFAMMNLGDVEPASGTLDRNVLRPLDRWILSRVNSTTAEVNRALSVFRFDEASNAIYQFFWKEFCDWYIEMLKPVLSGRHGSESERETSRRVLLEVLDRSLRLLHPFMPFITEEIWLKLPGSSGSIMVAPYPHTEVELEDSEAEQSFELVQDLVTTIRNLRAARGYAPGDRFTLFLYTADPRMQRMLEEQSYLMVELARLSALHVNGTAPDGAVRDTIRGIDMAVVLPERELTAEQIEQQARKIEQLEKELEGVRARLADGKFVERAPAHIVDGARRQEQDLVSRLETLRGNRMAGSA